MDPKINNFQNFQKPYNMLFSYDLSTSVQNFKSIAQFLTPKWTVFVSEIIPIYAVTFSNAIHCNFWGSYVKTNGTIRFLRKNWSR